MRASGRIVGERAAAAFALRSDEHLMAQVQAEDPEALGELYNRYSERVLRVAMSVCRDRGRAEDAVQETFVSIWRARATFRGDRGTVATWLMSVARHRAIDVGRRTARHATWEVGDDHWAAHASRVDAATAEPDGAERLQTLLAKLPDAQRQVISLAFYGELSHVEIAERLDLPPGTVKGRMRLGMRKLRWAVAQDTD